MMTYQQAIKIAISNIDKRVQQITFDANLYGRFGAPHGEKYFKEREKLLSAKRILLLEIEDRKKSENTDDDILPPEQQQLF